MKSVFSFLIEPNLLTCRGVEIHFLQPNFQDAFVFLDVTFVLTLYMLALTYFPSKL